MSEKLLSRASLTNATYLPYLCLAFGIIGLSMSAIFVRWAQAPGPVAGFYRVGIAALIMALPVASRVKRQGQAGSRLSRRHLWIAALAGLLFAGDLATWNTSVLITNAANATLLGNTAPIWVSLGALILFRERLGAGFWAGLGLAMLGAVVILGGDFLAHPIVGIGDLLAMTAGVFYGCFLLATERARRGLSSLLTWWVAACVSTLGLLLVSLALRQPVAGYGLVTYLNLIAAALISQLGGYLSINFALGHLPASVVSPTLLGQPVLTAVIAVPLLGESISWSQVVGGLIVLSGIWLVHRYKREQGEVPVPVA